MLLSEAIKAGAKLRPQHFDSLFGRKTSTSEVGTCALGAAAEVIGLIQFKRRFRVKNISLTVDFPLLSETIESLPCRCPLGDLVSTHIRSAITHLNDEHRWSRERIAQWVAYLERK